MLGGKLTVLKERNHFFLCFGSELYCCYVNRTQIYFPFGILRTLTLSSCQITFVHISSISARFPHFSTLLYINTYNCVLDVDGGAATSGDEVIVVILLVMVMVVVIVVFVVVKGYYCLCSGFGNACDSLLN